MNKNIKKRIFFEIIISYVAVITVLFIVIFTYSYNNIINKEYERVQKDIALFFQSEQENLEEKLSNVFLINNIIKTNSEINLLQTLERPIDAEDIDNLTELSEELSRFILPYNFVNEVYVYLDKSELFISNQTSGVLSDVYFNAHLNDWGSSFEDIKSLFSENPTQSIKIISNTKEISVIFYNSEYEDMYAAFLLDSDEIFNYKELIASYPNLHFDLINESNDILYSYGEDFSTNEELTFSSNFDFFNISMNLKISKDDISQITNDTNITFFATYIFTLLVSILIAIFFTKRMSNPVSQLIDQTNVASNGGGGMRLVFSDISSSFSNLKETNTVLSEELNHFSKGFEDVFINKLLKRYSFTKKEFELVPPHMEKFFSFQNYCVIGIKLSFDDIEQAIIQESLLSKILLNKFEYTYLYKVEYDRFMLVIATQNDENDIFDKVITFKENCIENDVNSKFYVGNSVAICDDLHLSYSAVINLMDYYIDDYKRIITYKDNVVVAQNSEYTINKEQQMIYFVLNNDFESARELVDSLFEDLTPNNSKFRSLVNSICFTMRRIESKMPTLSQEDSKNLLFLIKSIENQTEQVGVTDSIKLIINSFEEISNKNKFEQNDVFIIKISNYINENFTNPELSLAKISDEFKVSESYLSIFYKQKTGENISTFIEKLRMDEAKRLLINTSINVAEIAEKCGYYNSNTFYKAFKRTFGVTTKTFLSK